MNTLLNFLLVELKLKNDAALARKLNVGPPVISKLRHGKLELGASLILAIHETTGIPVKRIREMVAA